MIEKQIPVESSLFLPTVHNLSVLWFNDFAPFLSGFFKASITSLRINGSNSKNLGLRKRFFFKQNSAHFFYVLQKLLCSRQLKSFFCSVLVKIEFVISMFKKSPFKHFKWKKKGGFVLTCLDCNCLLKTFSFSLAFCCKSQNFYQVLQNNFFFFSSIFLIKQEVFAIQKPNRV